MIAICLPKGQRSKARRAMIENAPMRLAAKDPIYEVSPAHLELLNARGFSYEIVIPPVGRRENQRRAASH